jgi:hypothetical protein
MAGPISWRAARAGRLIIISPTATIPAKLSDFGFLGVLWVGICCRHCLGPPSGGVVPCGATT